jgi:aspartate aminotransferase-like enzyme
MSNGYGKLKDKTFRIGHMGDIDMPDLEVLLKAIEEIAGLK